MRRKLYLFFVLASLILIVPFLSAGFFSDAWGKITGKATSGTTALNVTIQSFPTIDFVRVNGSITLIENSFINVTLHFVANDTGGANKLNNATARIEVNRTGETTRFSSNCDPISQSLTTITYNCSFILWYFDGAGTWAINATIQDTAGNWATNQSATITVNALNAMTLGPTSLGWPLLNITSVNISATSNITINNTGNKASSWINVTSYDLRGETNIAQFLMSRNFSIENWTSTFGCNGDKWLTNATGTNITSAVLGKGNNSILTFNSSSGQQPLYFCVRQLNQSVTPQSFSTAYTGGTALPWNIGMV